MNYELLTVYADALDDYEKARIASRNRARALGQIKGLEGSPEAERMAALADPFEFAERQTTRDLQKAVKAHPLGPWVERTKGIGLKQAGRLLGALGDPSLRGEEERSLGQLMSLAGYGDAKKQRRRRGEKANWSPQIKMRVYLIAESCIKQSASPYRAVYDAGRAKYADAVHDEECRRCGPSGKPAQPGSDLSDGHKHARAMRLVSKAILRDLWTEARALRGHRGCDTQSSDAPQKAA